VDNAPCLLAESLFGDYPCFCRKRYKKHLIRPFVIKYVPFIFEYLVLPFFLKKRLAALTMFALLPTRRKMCL